MMELESSVFVSPSSQSDMKHQQMAIGAVPSVSAPASASASASRQLMGGQQLLSGGYYQSMRPSHPLSHHNLSLMNLSQIPNHSQQAAAGLYAPPAVGQSNTFHGSLSNINLMTSLAAAEQQAQRPPMTVDYASQIDSSGLYRQNGNMAHAQGPSAATGPPVYPSRPASASASLLGAQQSAASTSAATANNQQRYVTQAQAQAQAQALAQAQANALLMVAPSFNDSSHQSKLLSPAHAVMWGRNAGPGPTTGLGSASSHISALTPSGQAGHAEPAGAGAGAGGSASPSESCGSQSNAPSCLQTSGSVGTSTGTGNGAAGTNACANYALVHKKRRYKEVAVMQPDGNGQPTYICGVCGDRALGYNFDAITCESCKAFFRRNAQKMKPIKCNFDGNCKIDAQTRKFCPGCRLKKCIAIGMRREWILSEEQLALRRQKGRVNKIRRQQQHLHHSLHQAGLPGLALLPSSAAHFTRVPDDCCYDASSTQRSVSRSSSVCSSRSAEAPQSYRSGGELKPCVVAAHSDEADRHAHGHGHAAGPTGSCALTVQVCGPHAGALRGGSVWSEVSPQAEQYITAAGAAQAQATGASACANWSTLRPLSEVDTILLDVLQRLLYEVMEVAVDVDLSDEGGGERRQQPADLDPHVGNYLKLTDSFIRRFIKFCKCVPEFAQLRQDDQIALLKGGVMEAIVLRGALLFDASTRRWHLRCPWTADNQVQALGVDCVRRFLEPFADGSAFLDSYVQFLDSLFELTQRNRLLMLLLLLIELFSSDRLGLVNKLQVSQAQEKYLALLRHYLESLADHNTVRRLFPALLLKLADARDVATGLNRIFTKVDWSNVEPLLGEMFAPFTKR